MFTSFLQAILVVVQVLTSALLIGIIFLQKTKGGMGMSFGGGSGEAIFGSRMGNVLTKSTVILGTIFLVNTTILAYMGKKNDSAVSVVDKYAAPAPVAPALPMGGGAMPTPDFSGQLGDVAPVAPAPVVPAVPAEAPADVPAVPVEAPAPPAE